MAGRYDSLVGELTPGKYGWLPLGLDGVPSGPATLMPPPAPAMACNVFANPEGSEEALVSASGAQLGEFLNSNVDWRDPEAISPPPLVPPVLTSITPDTAVVGDGLTTFSLTATGSDFKADSVIVYGGVDAVTVFVDATSLTASPFNSATAGPVEVSVRDGGGTSASLPLTWTAAAVREASHGKKHDSDDHERRRK